MNALNFHTLICQVDAALRTLLPPRERVPSRSSPAGDLPPSSLTEAEQKHVAGLVRVNHAGEVSAQGLYQGQALTARLTEVKIQMEQAALEEVDHLAWCEERLHELHASPSFLNPLWYTGSLMIGALAGLMGDGYSLGFVAETEKQVTAHLESHLSRLPKHDLKTKAILELMQEDEAHHAEVAIQAGAKALPLPIQVLMQGISKVMTKTSYYF